MKKIITFLLTYALVLQVIAVDRITATLTVTGIPTDGDSITVNSDTRTWKTTVATPATQIEIGADANISATNILNQFLNYGFTPYKQLF